MTALSVRSPELFRSTCDEYEAPAEARTLMRLATFRRSLLGGNRFGRARGRQLEDRPRDQLRIVVLRQVAAVR
jgi:hypothetical protein